MDNQTISESAKAAPKGAEVRTAEQWAEVRGHLPEFRPGEPRKDKPKAVVKPVHNKDFALYTGALYHEFGGVRGREMTLAAYDAAVKAATDHVYR